MTGSQQHQASTARCTLCPAGCGLELVSTGPDAWRIEYPLTETTGLCPRGASLGELLYHPSRILSPTKRRNDCSHEISLDTAMQEIIDLAAGKDLTILLDGNLPCEELSAASAWCKASIRMKLCLVIEPSDEQLLLGTEASGAKYLSSDKLAKCDGFVIVGDAFAANPICSRGIFERCQSEPGTPVLTIDPAAGTASKFASHKVQADL
ncbi:MAG: hypothetical protein ACYSTL_06210, partial [Planctomycetota bacterium]